EHVTRCGEGTSASFARTYHNTPGSNTRMAAGCSIRGMPYGQCSGEVCGAPCLYIFYFLHFSWRFSKDWSGNYVAGMDPAAVCGRGNRAAHFGAAAATAIQACNHLPHRGDGSDLSGHGVSAARRPGASAGGGAGRLPDGGGDRGGDSQPLLPQAGTGGVTIRSAAKRVRLHSERV